MNGRFLCWVQLKHRSTGRAVFFATHHGNFGGAAPERILDAMKKYIPSNPTDSTALLVGDFNANSGSRTIQGIAEQMDKLPEDYSGGSDEIDIDHHFVSRGLMGPGSGGISLGRGGSDHGQMLATIVLK